MKHKMTKTVAEFVAAQRIKGANNTRVGRLVAKNFPDYVKSEYLDGDVDPFDEKNYWNCGFYYIRFAEEVLNLSDAEDWRKPLGEWK